VFGKTLDVNPQVASLAAENLAARDGTPSVDDRLDRDYAALLTKINGVPEPYFPPGAVTQGPGFANRHPVLFDDVTGEAPVALDLDTGELHFRSPETGFVNLGPLQSKDSDELFLFKGADGQTVAAFKTDGTLAVASVEPAFAALASPGAPPLAIAGGAITSHDASGAVTITPPAGVAFSAALPSGPSIKAVWNKPSIGATTRIRMSTDGGFVMPDAENLLLVIGSFGHSMSTGSNGVGPYNVTQVFKPRHGKHLLMADTGPLSEVRNGRYTGAGAATPAFNENTIIGTRPAKSFQSGNGTNISIETLGVRMFEDAVNQLGFAPKVLLTGYGIGECGLTQWVSGGVHYQSMMRGHTKQVALAVAAGLKPFLPCLFVEFGAQDVFNATSYAQLIALQTAVNTDLKAIYGQTSDIPWIMSVHSEYYDTGWRFIEALALASANFPERFIPSTPLYMLPTASDNIHLASESYLPLGEYSARAFKKLLAGRRWEIIRPLTVSRAGAVITATFNNVSALQFDAAISERASTYKGFHFIRDTVELPIVSHSFTNATTLVLNLASNPGAGGAQELFYAMKGFVASPTRDPAEQARGQLCDSETEVSKYSARVLRNYCTPFRFPL
jgi:hypothetical protein